MTLHLHRSVEQLGRVEALDRVAGPLAKLVKRVVPAKSTVKDALSGSWLGHPLHPMLTDVPIGSFTSATVLDLIGGRGASKAADRLVEVGLLAAVATAASGAADWSDTYGREQRVGVVHAAANVTAVGFYAASAVARHRHRRARATLLGLAGLGALSLGGYLGGYLSYGRAVGVNHAFGEEPPEDWTAVLDDSALPAGGSRKVDVGGAAILLHRHGPAVTAIGSRCTHAGGPLEDGEIDDAACTVTCPWHQSVFRLDDGAVVHGPATVPQTAYETRVNEGKIEVRAAAQ
jgi:nitrite reductase/ring-hydroxylating ferredoxin subunit/uncharacterized membrane protein